MTPRLLPSMTVALLFAGILARGFGLALRRSGPWGTVDAAVVASGVLFRTLVTPLHVLVITGKMALSI